MTTRPASTDTATGPPSTDEVPRPHVAPSLVWSDGAIRVIDQRALPHETRWVRLETVDEVIEAIRSLAVRGAPAIGLAGALGVALSARAHTAEDGTTNMAAVRADAERIATARPTAVNLAWAVARVVERLPLVPAGPAGGCATGIFWRNTRCLKKHAPRCSGTRRSVRRSLTTTGHSFTTSRCSQ